MGCWGHRPHGLARLGASIDCRLGVRDHSPLAYRGRQHAQNAQRVSREKGRRSNARHGISPGMVRDASASGPASKYGSLPRLHGPRQGRGPLPAIPNCDAAVCMGCVRFGVINSGGTQVAVPCASTCRLLAQRSPVETLVTIIRCLQGAGGGHFRGQTDRLLII